MKPIELTDLKEDSRFHAEIHDSRFIFTWKSGTGEGPDTVCHRQLQAWIRYDDQRKSIEISCCSATTWRDNIKLSPFSSSWRLFLTEAVYWAQAAPGWVPELPRVSRSAKTSRSDCHCCGCLVCFGLFWVIVLNHFGLVWIILIHFVWTVCCFCFCIEAAASEGPTPGAWVPPSWRPR